MRQKIAMGMAGLTLVLGTAYLRLGYEHAQALPMPNSIGATVGHPTVILRTKHFGLYKCRVGALDGKQVRGFGCLKLSQAI